MSVRIRSHFVFLSCQLCSENKAALQNSSGRSDINFAFRPDDNRYLIVHECSAFERGGAYGLQSIRNFITYRTDPSRSVPEKLHAVW